MPSLPLFRWTSLLPALLPVWRSALAQVCLTVISMALAYPAHGQTLSVLHTFTGYSDGSWPRIGVTRDAAGNLYGTAYGGDSDGSGGGVVYRMQQKNSSWILSPLYTFSYQNDDGNDADGKILIGADGSLYGVTYVGGIIGDCQDGHGCGTVYRLRPPITVCKTALCPWNETTLYRFTGGTDGAYPQGSLMFDQAGTLYGTTNYGGTQQFCDTPNSFCGVVYQLTSAGVESAIHVFTGGPGGAVPMGGVIADRAGNLYGTTSQGGTQGCSGNGCGTVFELSPGGSGWTQKVLYTFRGAADGATPTAGLVSDAAGNLYGATAGGGSGDGGVIFQLTPIRRRVVIPRCCTASTRPKARLCCPARARASPSTLQGTFMARRSLTVRFDMDRCSGCRLLVEAGRSRRCTISPAAQMAPIPSAM